MRLLIVNKFWYAKGGTETYLFDLLDELPAHGYDVVPFSMKHPLNRETPYSRFFVDEVDYTHRGPWLQDLRSAARMLYSAHARRNLEALLDEVRPDLAHVHNIYHQLSPSVLPVLRRRGIPVVMTLHDLKLACPNYKMRTHGEICERCIGGLYHHAVVHRCVQDSVVASALCATELFLHRRSRVYEDNVDRFIVPSNFYKSKLVQAGIPADKLVWLPTFVHIEQYEPRYAGSDYFVYVGRLSDEKGLLTLLEAVRGFDRGRLLIVGDGPMRPVLEKTILARGLTNVTLTGTKLGQELIDLMRGSLFSVVPSEWYENCPRSVVESFACGKPAIGANIGGIPELVEDGRTGLLFEPFSAAALRQKIDYLFDHQDVAIEMGRHARAKAERGYSAHAHVSQLLGLYASAMERREPPR